MELSLIPDWYKYRDSHIFVEMKKMATAGDWCIWPRQFSRVSDQSYLAITYILHVTANRIGVGNGVLEGFIGAILSLNIQLCEKKASHFCEYILVYSELLQLLCCHFQVELGKFCTIFFK